MLTLEIWRKEYKSKLSFLDNFSLFFAQRLWTLLGEVEVAQKPLGRFSASNGKVAEKRSRQQEPFFGMPASASRMWRRVDQGPKIDWAKTGEYIFCEPRPTDCMARVRIDGYVYWTISGLGGVSRIFTWNLDISILRWSHGTGFHKMWSTYLYKKMSRLRNIGHILEDTLHGEIITLFTAQSMVLHAEIIVMEVIPILT